MSVETQRVVNAIIQQLCDLAEAEQGKAEAAGDGFLGLSVRDRAIARSSAFVEAARVAQSTK